MIEALTDMTLREAIEHAKEVAETCDKKAQDCNLDDRAEFDKALSSAACAKQHRQLVAWLEELERYREILSKSGRLIDADALKAEMGKAAFDSNSNLTRWDSGCWIRYKLFEVKIREAPTVIEAERSWI